MEIQRDRQGNTTQQKEQHNTTQSFSEKDWHSVKIAVFVLCMFRLTMSSGGRGKLVMKFFLHNSAEAILV